MMIEGSLRRAGDAATHLDGATLTSETKVLEYICEQQLDGITFAQTQDSKGSAAWLAAATALLSVKPGLQFGTMSKLSSTAQLAEAAIAEKI